MRGAGPAVGAVLCLGLAGCAAAADEPAGLSAASVATTSAASSPVQTPDPSTAGPVDRSDPALGIVFTGLDSAPAQAVAPVDAITLFEVEYWSMLAAGQLDDAVGTVATADVVTGLQDSAANNAATQELASGVLGVRLVDVTAGESVAVVHLCHDWSQVTVTSPSGSTPAPMLVGADTELVTIEASTAQGGWRVSRFDLGDPC